MYVLTTHTDDLLIFCPPGPDPRTNCSSRSASSSSAAPSQSVLLLVLYCLAEEGAEGEESVGTLTAYQVTVEDEVKVEGEVMPGSVRKKVQAGRRGTYG